MDCKKTRVLHLINGLGCGGAEIVLSRLLGRLDPSRFSQSVISLTSEDELGPIFKRNCEHVELLGMTKGTALSAIPRLVKTVRQLQPDIIQCWMYPSNFLGGLLRPWLRPKGLVWGLHHSNLDRKVDKFSTRLVARASALLSYRADKIVSCSQSGLDFHQSIGYAKSRLAFIPNGFDTEVFKHSAEARKFLREELGVAEAALLIGTVARYHPTKGYPTLIKAARMFIQSNENVHFVMVGRDMTSDNSELRELIGKTNTPRRLHLLGERKDIPQIMPALDIYTSASYSEAFSLTIGEAMSCSTPCVVTDVGDSALIVGDTGLVVEPRSLDDLLGAWQHMVGIGSARRLRLGEMARQRIIEELSLDQFVQQYAAMYDEILKR